MSQSITRRLKRHPNDYPNSTKVAKCSMTVSTVRRKNKYAKKD